MAETCRTVKKLYKYMAKIIPKFPKASFYAGMLTVLSNRINKYQPEDPLVDTQRTVHPIPAPLLFQ
jgi:hypothetical protein